MKFYLTDGQGNNAYKNTQIGAYWKYVMKRKCRNNSDALDFHCFRDYFSYQFDKCPVFR